HRDARPPPRGVPCRDCRPDDPVRTCVQFKIARSLIAKPVPAFAARARQVMMSSHRFAASVFAVLLPVLALPAGGALAQTTVTSDPPASFTLGNGLQVVVIPDHRTPVVTEMIWYKVGSADETPGKSGL